MPVPLNSFVYHFVHAAAGVNQAGGQYGHAAALLGVSGGAEELLGRIQSHRVHAAGQRASAGRHRQVIGAREPRYAVQKYHHVAPRLHLPLGAFQNHLGHPAMILHRLVEGRTVHLAIHRAAHIGHFLGTFAYQRDHDANVGVVDGYAVGYLFQQGGLSGLRRGYYEAALSASDGSEQVNEPRGSVAGDCFQLDAIYGEDWGESFEPGPVARVFGPESVDLFDANQSEISFAVLRRSDLPYDVIAGPQSEAAYLRLRSIDVGRSGVGAVLPQKAVAVVDYGEHPTGLDRPFPLRHRLGHAGDQVMALVRAVQVCAKFPRRTSRVLRGTWSLFLQGTSSAPGRACFRSHRSGVASSGKV